MHAGNFETCNTSHLYKISMEIVGALPEPEEILPNTTSLFGILCKNVTESAECHFCLETIEDKEPRTFATPCCNQKVHCSCFERWAVTQLQQLVAQQFAVHIAEQYFLANSYVFYV